MAAGAGRDDKPSGGKARGRRAPAKTAAAATSTGGARPAGGAGRKVKKADNTTNTSNASNTAKTSKANKQGKSGRSGARRGGGGTRPGGQVADLLPVREGEERWSEQELTEVRTRLSEEIGNLRAEITAAETQIAEGDTSGGAGDDQADAGAKTYEREQEISLAYNARDLLDQSERAVARMDAGTYGVCESCGNAIGKARLQAFPRATLCVTCKQRQERR